MPKDHARIDRLMAATETAYTRGSYGDDRWAADIEELIDQSYTDEAIEWIMLSKIPRWADDMEESIIVYINNRVGPVRLREWMREEKCA